MSAISKLDQTAERISINAEKYQTEEVSIKEDERGGENCSRVALGAPTDRRRNGLDGHGKMKGEKEASVVYVQ